MPHGSPSTYAPGFQDAIAAAFGPITSLQHLMEDSENPVRPQYVADLLSAAKRDAMAFLADEYAKRHEILR